MRNTQAIRAIHKKNAAAMLRDIFFALRGKKKFSKITP